jgi:hypothetical protein
MEPRKATDVLIDIETKVNALLDMVRSQDLIIKILSNKLNDVMGKLEKQSQAAPKFTVEAIQAPVVPPPMPPGFTQIPAGDPDRTIPVAAQSRLPETDVPQGFRRNSRPETFAGDNAYLPHPEQEMRMPVQIPKGPPGRQAANMPPPGRGPGSEVVPAPLEPPNPRNNKQGVFAPPNPKGSPFAQHGTPNPMMAPESAQNSEVESQMIPVATQGQIPVMQRCVDKNGKSIFLADVELTDLSSGQPFFKTRTNGAGKWMASLGIGAYRVVITKRASGNKGMMEAVQDIQVDGSKSPLELPMIIIKEKA